jgi:hypothetical protein
MSCARTGKTPPRCDRSPYEASDSSYASDASEALDICIKAVPGTSQRMGHCPNCPVRLQDADLNVIRNYLDGNRGHPYGACTIVR